MSLEARIRELSTRHKNLENVLESERKHPSSSDTKLTDLKRQKLRLKDEIASLRER